MKYRCSILLSCFTVAFSLYSADIVQCGPLVFSKAIRDKDTIIHYDITSAAGMQTVANIYWIKQFDIYTLQEIRDLIKGREVAITNFKSTLYVSSDFSAEAEKNSVTYAEEGIINALFFKLAREHTTPLPHMSYDCQLSGPINDYALKLFQSKGISEIAKIIVKNKIVIVNAQTPEHYKELRQVLFDYANLSIIQSKEISHS